MVDLTDEVVDHALDLLGHGLGKDLRFYADLDRCHAATRDHKAAGLAGNDARHDLAKGPVAAPRLDTLPFVGDAQDTLTVIDPADKEL